MCPCRGKGKKGRITNLIRVGLPYIRKIKKTTKHNTEKGNVLEKKGRVTLHVPDPDLEIRVGGRSSRPLDKGGGRRSPKKNFFGSSGLSLV